MTVFVKECDDCEVDFGLTIPGGERLPIEYLGSKLVVEPRPGETRSVTVNFQPRGDMWVSLIWGSSDIEDPEFTTPWPEFHQEWERAAMSFINYARELMSARGQEEPEDFYATVETQLHEDGRAQVDLDDGCCVSCAIYPVWASGRKGRP